MVVSFVSIVLWLNFNKQKMQRYWVQQITESSNSTITSPSEEAFSLQSGYTTLDDESGYNSDDIQNIQNGISNHAYHEEIELQEIERNPAVIAEHE